MISGPSECGKTCLLKNLFLNNLDFDNSFIIAPTWDQYGNFRHAHFIADINQLAKPVTLRYNIKDSNDI